MNRAAPSLSLLAAVLASCAGASQEEPPAPLAVVATAQADELTVELLTRAPGLATGMTPVYLRITDGAGRAVTDAEVTFAPEMAMSAAPTHGAPVLGAPVLGADGLYHVDVVFQMASGPMGSWTAVAAVTRPAAATVVATFPSLAVSDAGRARTFQHFDPEAVATSKYVASLNFRAAPRVGLNPVVATLHRMQDRMTFVPVTDAAMALDPQMSSMGHGSPGSVDPVSTTLGRYEGQLSFSMAGEWETTLTIARGGVAIGAPRFTTSF